MHMFADPGLLAAVSFDTTAFVLRLLHIAAAILAAGAIFFQRLALHPSLASLSDEQRSAVREGIAARWRTIALASIAVLLITGLLNFFLYKIPQLRGTPTAGLYHGLFAVKLLAALVVFHGATLLVLPGAKGLAARAAARPRLSLLAVLLALIVVVAAVMRNISAA